MAADLPAEVGKTAELPLPIVSYGRPLAWRFERLGEFMSAIGTIWIFVLLVLVNTDVIGRGIFSAPLPGVPELLGLSIVGIVYMQLPNTLWAGRFTRAEFLSEAIDRRWPRAGSLLRGFYHLLGLILISILLYALLPEFQRAWSLGDYVGSIGNFTAPTWPVRLVMVVGSAVTAITYLLLLMIDLRDALTEPK